MVNTPTQIFYQGHNFLKLDTTLAQAVDIACSAYALGWLILGMYEASGTQGLPFPEDAKNLLPAAAQVTQYIEQHPLFVTPVWAQLGTALLARIKPQAQLMGAGRAGSSVDMQEWYSSSGDLARVLLFSQDGINYTAHLLSPDSLALDQKAVWIQDMQGISLPFFEESVEFQQEFYGNLPEPLPSNTYLAEILERSGRVVAENAFLARWKTLRGQKTPSNYSPEFATEQDLDRAIELAQNKAEVLLKGGFRYAQEDGQAPFFLAIQQRAEAEAQRHVDTSLPTQGSWPSIYVRVVRTVLKEPRHQTYYQNAAGVSSPEELALVKDVRVQVNKLPDDAVIWEQLNQGVAVWQRGLRFDLDLSGLKGALGSIKQGIAKGQEVSKAFSETRKEVQGKVLTWYKAGKDVALAPLKDIAAGMGDLGKVGEMPEGVTLKFILPQPVVGSQALVSSLTSSLSTLRAESPVFKRDADVDIGAFLLVMYSKDPLGSLLIWLLMTSVIFGYNFVPDEQGGTGENRFQQLIDIAKDAGLTVVAKQFEALVAAGKAPSAGEIQSALGGFSNVWSLTTEANKQFTDWVDKIKESGSKVAATGPKLMAAVNEALGQLNPAQTTEQSYPDPLQLGAELQTNQETTAAIKDPFDTWYEIFSLKGLLGPIGQSLDTVLGATSAVLKEGGSLLNTVVQGADSVSDAYVRIATSALDATDQAASVGLKTADSAINILDEALSSLSTPSFGALLVPPITGGTEKLRFALAQMIAESPDKPEELDSPYGLIMPLLVVVASDVTGVARTAWDKVGDMFKIVKGTVVDTSTGEPKQIHEVLQGSATGNALENLDQLLNNNN